MNTCIDIYIVDDHKIVRDGLRAMLMGVPDIKIIGESSKGTDFIKSLENNQPHIVILDIGLPDISGLEIAKILKEKFPDVKIIILTANTDEESIIGAVKNGAAGFLSKDASKEEFLEAIRIVNEGIQYFSEAISKIIYSGYINTIRQEHDSDIKPLSIREIEVIKLITDGLSYKDIAEKLFISSRTVETHRNNILEKLELKNNVELVKYAIKHKICSLD